MVDALSSSSCPILFKVLMLNVAICMVRLHLSNFGLSLVADFSNTETRAPTSTGRAPFLHMWFECGSWLSLNGCFYSHLQKLPYR